MNVTLKAPPGVSSINVGATAYPVANGEVSIPAQFVAQLLGGGFLPAMNTAIRMVNATVTTTPQDVTFNDLGFRPKAILCIGSLSAGSIGLCAGLANAEDINGQANIIYDQTSLGVTASLGALFTMYASPSGEMCTGTLTKLTDSGFTVSMGMDTGLGRTAIMLFLALG